MSTFQERLQEAMEEEGMTQKELSDKIRSVQPYISQILNGKKMPSERMSNDMAEVLNVRPEWLFYGEGEKRPEPTREDEIARLANMYLSAEKDSFKSRLISALSRLDETQWEFLTKMAEEIEKREKS